MKGLHWLTLLERDGFVSPTLINVKALISEPIVSLTQVLFP